MAAVTFSKDASGRITVVFQYDPLRVQKVKTIEDRKWHPEEKHWSFPSSDEILEKILKVFEGEEIQIDPTLTLQAEHTTPVIERYGLPHPRPEIHTGIIRTPEFEDHRNLYACKYKGFHEDKKSIGSNSWRKGV